MRVSPIGWNFNNVKDVLKNVKTSTLVSHNYKEGIKGAQAIALAVFYARKGYIKDFIRKQLEKRFKYNLNRKISSFKRKYILDITCQGSVPEAIICFLESRNYIDAIRNTIALGGNADTLACMADAIAETYYKYIPWSVIIKAWKYIPKFERRIIKTFYEESIYENNFVQTIEFIKFNKKCYQ
jgi:ADP-ribosylglycohydrolase